MDRGIRLRPVVAGVALALAQMAGAQDAATLSEVVVSGSRAATPLLETPVSIGVVKADALRRDKPKSMGDVLNRIPGVSWNDLGNEQHSMGIRQPNSTNAMYQYLEDGIPIRPLGVFNHNSLNEMNMAGVERVEVVKGAASSLYGSNAVGGAVNFLTARPSPTPYASIGYRQDAVNGFRRVDTAASNTWGDLGLRFAHYSSRRDRDNWQTYSYGDKDSFTLRGDLALAGGSRVVATLTHSDLDSAMPGSLFEDDYRNDPGKSLNTFTYRKDKTTRMNLAWEGETVANGLTTATLFLRRNDHGQIPSYTISGSAAAVRAGTINNNHVESVGLDVKHEQLFAALNGRLVGGVYLDFSKNPYWSNNLSIVRDPVTGRHLSYTLNNTANPTGVRDYTTDIVNTALFAQYEFSPVPRLRAVVGGRFDAIEYDYHNNLTAGANYGAPDQKKRFSRFSPKVGATYALTPASGIFGNFSQGFTPPEVGSLYGKYAVPDLKPSVYNSYELGYRAAFLDGKLRLETVAYRLDGRDTILSYTLAPGVSESRNAGRTRSTGLELGVSGDLGMADFRLGTTLANHRFVEYATSSTQDFNGKTMPGAPRHFTSAEVGLKPLQGVRVALEYVQQAGYWMNNANTVRYAGHRLWNLRATYAFAPGWEAWLQGRNLTDARYADSASSAYSGVGAYNPNTMNQYTAGAPRSVLVGLSYTFDGKGR